MRDTTTGNNYEKTVSKLLKESNYNYKDQVTIGKKRNGKKHRVDVLIDKTLVSLKHQEVNGTAEEKVPFEFMKLQHAVDDYDYDEAVIVLSGDTGWTWKEYYLSPEFKTNMKQVYPDVSIMSHQEFCETYNL
jgi:hypothetical protein